MSRRLGQTQLIIETPYRNAALLAAMLAGLHPETRVSISCGLTLDGGWSRTANVAAWRTQAARMPQMPHMPQMPDRWPAVFGLLAG